MYLEFIPVLVLLRIGGFIWLFPAFVFRGCLRKIFKATTKPFRNQIWVGGVNQVYMRTTIYMCTCTYVYIHILHAYMLWLNTKMHPSIILYIVPIIYYCGDLMKVTNYPSQKRQLVSKKRSPRMVQTVEQG